MQLYYVLVDKEFKTYWFRKLHIGLNVFENFPSKKSWFIDNISYPTFVPIEKLKFKCDTYKYIAVVTILNDAIIHTYNYKVQANKIFVERFIELENWDKWNDYEFCLKFVKRNPAAIQFIKEPSYELRMIAVKNGRNVLKYIDEQTEELCRIAIIKSDGFSFKDVKDKTLALCLLAVKKDPWNIQFVENQTPAVCLLAVKKIGLTIQHVRNPTLYICLEAIANDSTSIFYIRRQSYGMCRLAIQLDSVNIANIHNQTEELCLLAVKNRGKNLCHIRNKTRIICEVAIKNDPEAIIYVPPELKPFFIHTIFERQNPNTFKKFIQKISRIGNNIIG